MLEGCVIVPKDSVVIKYRHNEQLFIRVLGANTSETTCLRAKSLNTMIGMAARQLGELRCRVIQANESFTITVHTL